MRLSRLRSYLGIGRRLAARNGVRWLILFAAARATRSAAAAARLRRFEEGHRLPSFHSADIARAVWDAYDWSRRGEEWNATAEWVETVAAAVLRPRIPEGSTILEIGPGAGRWSEELRRRAARLILIDVSAKCIELCKRRFGGAPNVDYVVGDGRTLAPVADAAVDRIWSFDAFVHMDPDDIDSYLVEMRRALRPGGAAITHHAATGGSLGAWRSAMTSARFVELAVAAGLRVVEQFDSWGEGASRTGVGGPGDAIPVLSREP